MASAAARLSPEIITVRMLAACSCAMASRASDLGSSPKTSSASARGAAPGAPDSASTESVAARASGGTGRASSAAPSSPIQRRLPRSSGRSPTRPCVPRPGTASTSRGASSSRPRARAASITARASGCSLPPCRLAASASAASASTSGAGENASSRGRPRVRVPVLSKATVRTRWAISSASASLIRMPNFAATPVPAMIAVGVARPSAQGQAITSTATARITAVSMPASRYSHSPNVASPIRITSGTNTADTLSTSRCTGALPACASSTRRMMFASTLSLPAAVTSTTTRPSPLIEPPVSRSSTRLPTGSGSPVSMDSSTWVAPSSTRPSAGTRSPGRTARRSPGRSSSTGMSVSPPSTSIRCASSGRSACRARIAAVVWRLARASSHLPSSTRVTTTAALSKYRPPCSPCGENSHSHTDMAHAALVPMATNRSMLPVPALRACQPAR